MTVHAVDPAAARREAAQWWELSRVHEAVPLDDPSLRGQVGLVVECSGHEQATLDACRMVRKRGEVVLVGAVGTQDRPDRPRTPARGVPPVCGGAQWLGVGGARCSRRSSG